MTIIRVCELAAWAVFVVGLITMLTRGAFLRSTVQKYRTGWILALTMLLTGPVFAVVYTLAGLGIAETFFGQGGGRGPWFMAITGASLAACAPVITHPDIGRCAHRQRQIRTSFATRLATYSPGGSS